MTTNMKTYGLDKARIESMYRVLEKVIIKNMVNYTPGEMAAAFAHALASIGSASNLPMRIMQEVAHKAIHEYYEAIDPRKEEDAN